MTRTRRALLVVPLVSLVCRPITSWAATPPSGVDRVVRVANSTELGDAFADARPGDRIVVADGRYAIGSMTCVTGTAAGRWSTTGGWRC